MAIDPEEKSGMLGCLVGVLAVGGAIAGIVWFSQQDFSTDPVAASRSSGTALTRVDPVREKTVVKKAIKVGPESMKVSTDDPEAEPSAAAGVTAAVQDLGQMTDEEPPSPQPEIAALYDSVLASEPLCYHGRIARRAPSLFTKAGFAVTYGADTYNTGDPLPRIEIFFDDPLAPTEASYLSMTHSPLREFPDHEVAVSYSEAALSAVIAKWIASVATETCPDKAPPPAAVVD